MIGAYLPSDRQDNLIGTTICLPWCRDFSGDSSRRDQSLSFSPLHSHVQSISWRRHRNISHCFKFKSEYLGGHGQVFRAWWRRLRGPGFFDIWISIATDGARRVLGYIDRGFVVRIRSRCVLPDVSPSVRLLVHIDFPPCVRHVNQAHLTVRALTFLQWLRGRDRRIHKAMSDWRWSGFGEWLS